MTRLIKILSLGLVLLLGAGLAFAGDDNGLTEKYTLWIGGHYTDFNDYAKKAGEYNLGNDEFLPEFKLNYFSRSDRGIFRLDGHYYDDKNINAEIRTTISDVFKGKFMYRSLIKQASQNLLTEIEAREYFESTGVAGGKMLTHEILDPGADYNTHRQEILGEVSLLLSRKNNVRMIAAHRTILTTGSEQKISSNHCFSCHLTSQTAEVDKRKHQFEAGVDAETGKFDIGYRFGYRYFETEATDASTYYDPAKHPLSGGAAAEFSSRVIYHDSTMAFSTYPTTEKTSHKVRVKGDVGKGRFSGAAGYSRAENKNTSLTTDAWSGSLNYTVPLNPKTRLVAKFAATRLSADDPFIDLPTWRDGATDGNEYNFDYTRYSALDRRTGKLTAELIRRLNKKMTLSVLAGYDRVERYDYPLPDDGTETSKLIGQAKLRIRKGLKYTSTVKYRFESISDPYVSARGLFEESGHDVLTPLVPTSNWIFYFQREDLRYQDITTQPTQVHQFEWRSNYRPNNKVVVNLGVKGKYDKNGDLDSLDVEHFSLAPNLNLNLIPDQRWALTAGYAYNYDKSRLPVTVALFDG